GDLPVLRWLARRKNRNQSPGAVDQLKVDRKLTQLFQRRPLEQPVALDDDENVEFVRGKTVRDLFVGPEFVGIGSKQLAQRIVDFYPRETDCCKEAKHDKDHRAERAV